ncbi:MAG TPA: GNAT family N-acetyltransferase [Solirubrobacteraceae bacterium]|nr:GNAT family N-acetyltransferase [Solirubrobacteraceae bacterium]
MTSLARALSFAWEVHDAEADAAERIALGTALRSPSLPHAYDTNGVRVEVPTDLGLDDLQVAAAAHVPEVGYQRLRIEHDGDVDRLVRDARARPGWTAEIELVMLLDPAAAPPAPGPDAPTCREGALEDVLTLMRPWFGEEGIEGVELDQCLQMAARQHEAKDERRFIVDDEGAPAAMCSLRRDGSGVAQLENVFVLPRVRGRSLGAAVVHAATRAAVDEGHEVVFIMADDEGWPKDLYARAGFRGAARRAIVQHGPR